jgi:hypothetical protein
MAVAVTCKRDIGNMHEWNGCSTFSQQNLLGILSEGAHAAGVSKVAGKGACSQPAYIESAQLKDK